MGLIKYLGNESKRVVCCKITISKDVSDAQKLIKHLKLKERCARFKCGSKSKKTSFDFYVIPPTKSNTYLNADFVNDNFDTTISNKKMWGVVVLPIQSFNKVHRASSPSKIRMKHKIAVPQSNNSVLDALNGLTSPANKAKVSTTESSSSILSNDSSVLDDKFFSNLDGLASILGVDDSIVVENKNEEETKEKEVKVKEKLVDPRMRS